MTTLPRGEGVATGGLVSGGASAIFFSRSQKSEVRWNRLPHLLEEFEFFGTLCGVGVFFVLVAFEFAEHFFAEVAFGEHASDGHFEDGVGFALEEVFEGGDAV